MARCRSYLRGLSICVTVLLMASGVVMIGVGFSSIDGNIPVAEVTRYVKVLLLPAVLLADVTQLEGINEYEIICKEKFNSLNEREE
ncbi:hypothetical protein E3U43_020886 [Larimichthys crocea]|uniref:Uncharacterized protein n=1 Tax=Larimichthys crocea TaxID=215358 RepID=A0ACD3Q6U9_LARCR|nr:hypothetical protein E3U43_020886 [Larimichthys crocea]